MRILITGNTMDNFSGQPMSTYESARVLARDHDVTVICGYGGWNKNELQLNLEKLGVKCGYQYDEEYDLILVSEYCPPNIRGFKIQTVRGITDWESPLEGMDFYACIRPDVQEHIIKEHGILEINTKVVYNGVDMTRFKPRVKSSRYYTKIVAPCTIDKLRQKWVEYLCSIASLDRQVVFYTPRQDYIIASNAFVSIKKPTFHMEYEIADSDLVVGIYLSRVHLEARACGVPSIIYDPVTLLAEKFDITDEEFEKRHNIESTVNNLLNIYYENRQ